MRAVLVLKDVDFNISPYLLKDDIIIGVDAGALIAKSQGFLVDYAIGDFDSITDLEYESLVSTTKKTIKLNPIKDDTDTLVALSYAKQFTNDIIILGGIKGKRIEHFYANLQLVFLNRSLMIIDDNSQIFSLNPGAYDMDNEYQYLSLFAIEDIKEITLEGVKYPLNKYNLKRNDSIGISNEVIKKGKISFDSGLLLVIRSKQDA